MCFCTNCVNTLSRCWCLFGSAPSVCSQAGVHTCSSLSVSPSLCVAGCAECVCVCVCVCVGVCVCLCVCVDCLNSQTPKFRLHCLRGIEPWLKLDSSIIYCIKRPQLPVVLSTELLTTEDSLCR